MTRKTVEFVHSGKYAAEVQVELIEDEGDWAPRLSPHDTPRPVPKRRCMTTSRVNPATALSFHNLSGRAPGSARPETTFRTKAAWPTMPARPDFAGFAMN